MKPLISVIMPTYNNEKTISLAIDSILNQTFPNIELIVVDDKSTDETKRVVEEKIRSGAKITLLDGVNDPNRFDPKLNRNINAGYSARNVGLRAAKGDLITFQDADDVSLLNRIEVQYELLTKYNATHLVTDWVQFDEKYAGKKLNSEEYLKNVKVMGPNELFDLSQRSKGLIAKISPLLHHIVPFHHKRARIINKLFFGSLENYPGAGNSPLFKREVIEKVQFRRLADRIWPSFMGRGADKDFNFQTAETFKNSYFVSIPLYLWKTPTQNPNQSGNLNLL